jgi:hypothetical protein
MTRFKTMLGATALVLAMPAFALPAFAEITIEGAYARVSTAMSKSGAAFMVVHNSGAEDDQMIDAKAEISDRVELHTHKADANGVMQMLHVPEGFTIPAGGMHELKRGADHVMFLGLKNTLSHGDVVHVTLTFEKAGDIEIDIPVDLEKDAAAMGAAANGMQMQMQEMKGAPEDMVPQHQH